MGVQYDDEGPPSNEAVLRVKSSSSAASLASAISHAVYDGKRVTLRAIGAGAVNQAMKAIAIANSFVAPRGIVLDCRPGFTTVTTQDAGDISALLLRIFVH
jgi:stage V sporulation protein S